MIKRSLRLHPIVLALVSFSFALPVHADWPNWRGPNLSGGAEVVSSPEGLDESNLRWKIDLPGKGYSTPIVLDNSIYLTAPVDGNDAVHAIDMDGKELWKTTFGSEDAGKHRNGSGCNASAVTDGSGVFTYFKSGTLAALDLDGSVRWKTNLVERFGKHTLYWDHGTSPVLTQKHVIVARMQHGESWVAAFDKLSGSLAWKIARNYETPRECDHGYTTPLVIEHNGEEALLVWGAEHLTIHRVTDGKVVWTCGNFNPDASELWPAVATPVVVKGMAVVCYGRNDRGSPLMFGIRLTGSGDVTKTNHVWQRDDISSFVPSPAAYQDNVYLVRDRGEVECIDPTNGETIWSDRFPKSRKNYYASPLVVDGKLYAPREDGAVFVASIMDREFSLLSTNELEESVIGSPVPVGESGVLIRGQNHLYYFASN